MKSTAVDLTLEFCMINMFGKVDKSSWKSDIYWKIIIEDIRMQTICIIILRHLPFESQPWNKFQRYKFWLFD
jgi:hypothetical protein